MAGLSRPKDVDAQDKPGHDEKGRNRSPDFALTLSRVLSTNADHVPADSLTRVAGSTFTPGPMVEDTATRWM
jgi:hypothetical protein